MDGGYIEILLYKHKYLFEIALLLFISLQCIATYVQCFTLEPVFNGHPLSSHPLLSGQLSKSRKYCQDIIVNKTLIKQPWPPFGFPDEDTVYCFYLY